MRGAVARWPSVAAVSSKGACGGAEFGGATCAARKARERRVLYRESALTTCSGECPAHEAVSILRHLNVTSPRQARLPKTHKRGPHRGVGDPKAPSPTHLTARSPRFEPLHRPRPGQRPLPRRIPQHPSEGGEDGRDVAHHGDGSPQRDEVVELELADRGVRPLGFEARSLVCVPGSADGSDRARQWLAGVHGGRRPWSRRATDVVMPRRVISRPGGSVSCGEREGEARGLVDHAVSGRRAMVVDAHCCTRLLYTRQSPGSFS